MTIFRSIFQVFLLWGLASSQCIAELTIKIKPKHKGLNQSVVYLTPINGSISLKQPNPSQVVQKQRLFSPYIQIVTKGTRVAFPNEDPFAHHVYSFSKSKSFELPLYRGDEGNAPEVQFDVPGVVVLGCNIHDWMLSYLLVLDTPYFARVESSEVVMDYVPAGKYKINVWHPSLREKEIWYDEIEVESNTRQIVIDIGKKFPDLVQPEPDESNDDLLFYD